MPSSTDPTPPPSPTSNPLLTARTLFLLQLLTRLLTFFLNQSLIRLAPPSVLGTASIQFDLICSTVLFLSREGVRTALLRQSPTSSPPSQSRALSAVPFSLGIIVSSLTLTLYLSTSDATTTSQPYFHVSLGLYTISALLELAIEPHYIRALTSSPPRLRVRVQAEGGMAVVRAVVTVGMLVGLERRPGWQGGKGALLGFGVGQAAGAGWLVARYVWEYGVEGMVWPGRVAGHARFDAAQRSLAIANTRQSFVKHLLTEGDRIAVGRISPLEDQGGYAVAINYGSLIARIIFQPLEETLLLHFSRTSSTSPSTPQLLSLIIHFSSYLLVLLPAFVPPLLPPLLPLLLPRRYLATSAPRVLQTYLGYYIPLLSLNGLLEAFHAATATPAQMGLQARWMLGSSLAFVAALWALTRGEGVFSIGREEALICASCVGMAVRIGYSYAHARGFMSRHYGERGADAMSLREVVPKRPIILLAGAAAGMLRAEERKEELGLKGAWRLLGMGAMHGVTTLAFLVNTEWENVRLLMRGGQQPDGKDVRRPAARDGGVDAKVNKDDPQVADRRAS